jgi:hypothetical protein
LRSIEERPDGKKLRADALSLAFDRLPPEDVELLKKHREEVCVYYGDFDTAGAPLGPWRHLMHVQTVNTVRPGTDPVVAAQVIGGLSASNHMTSKVDVACGPFVIEDDGSFDIELLSI